VAIDTFDATPLSRTVALVTYTRIPQLLGPKGTRNGLAEHETGFGPGYTSRHD
jgi:hypothetical protein